MIHAVKNVHIGNTNVSRVMLGDLQVWPSGYVSNGLLIRLDGIQNTRAGHNQNATVWEDLTGNGFDIPLFNLSSNWESDCFNTLGSAYGSLSKTINLNEFTLECVLKENARATNTLVVNIRRSGVSFDLISGYYYGGSNMFYTINGGSAVEVPSSVYPGLNTSFTSSFSGNANGRKVFANNVFLNGDAVVFSPATLNVVSLFTYTGGIRNARLYSLRVYNRALSDSERTQNYNVDKARFNIP